jgi:hypothetical protein
MSVFGFMRRLSLKCVVLCGLVLVVGNVCGQQSGNFNGTIVDLDSGRIQTFQGQTIDRDRDHRERMESYKRITAETSASIDAMRQEGEMQQQTDELRKQTELLRKMSKEGSGGSSSSYMPPPRIVAPSSYVPPTSSVPQESKEERAAKFKAQHETSQINDAIRSAKGARSFNAGNKQPRERQLSANESPEFGDLNSPKNDKLIEGLLQGYKGNFTDYAWSAERVDDQTFIVTCSASLDGIAHDFRFRVNNAARTCRYEGGTALEKLAPPQAKRKITFLDEETPSVKSSEGFDPSKPYTIEEPADKEAKFDPDAYLMDATWLEGNKIVLNTKTLKEGREAGYSDEEIWSYLVSKDKSFAVERSAGRTLDQLAAAENDVGRGTALKSNAEERSAATKPRTLPATVRVRNEGDVQKLIQQMCGEMNSGLPRRIDAETVLLTTLPYTDNSLLYRCKMVNMTADQFEKGRITEAVKPQAVATYKSAMPNLLKLGVKLVYHYTDKDGTFIESFTVGPEDL